MPQHSPIVLWLLIAATLSVDSALFYLLVSQPYPNLAAFPYDALIVGQLSVVCVWSVLNISGSIWAMLAPLFAVIVASIAIGLFERPSFSWGLARYGTHTALLWIALWGLQRSNFWRRRSGAPMVWRYSIAHLLAVMTIVALLAALSRTAGLFTAEGWSESMVFLCSSVVVTTSIVIVWCSSQHWILRLAGIIGFATLFGTMSALIVRIPPAIGIHYMIQALVLSIWLGLGSILPLKADADE
jgi:hypothetical protein